MSIDMTQEDLIDANNYLADAELTIATLTEQLRLANEDAERLAEYVKHKQSCMWATNCGVIPRCQCKLSDVMYLHKKRIAQEEK